MLVPQRWLGHALSLIFVLGPGACAADAPLLGGGNDPVVSVPGSVPAEPLAVGPCRDGDTTKQRHGATCLCCHTDDFGVAGSIEPPGSVAVRVIVTDARGDVATMSPNLFGNFFRHFPMKPPLRAKIALPNGEERAMIADAPSADCNTCHWSAGSAPPLGGPSRTRDGAPGRDVHVHGP